MELIKQIAEALSESPIAPLVQGDFVGNAAGRTVTGLRMITPDGATRYLAVFDAEAFKSGGDVVAAAQSLLQARQHDMLTVEEHVALARAVAACTSRKTANLLTERDLEQVAEYGVAWDATADGPLPDAEA